MIENTRRLRAAVVFFAAAVSVTYFRVMQKLVHDWATDGNYSHGFLIVPLAAWFVWERRGQLAAIAVRPHWTGLVGVVGALAMLVAGLLGAELFLSRLSLVGVLAGAIVFVLGWRHLAAVAFPLAFLLLMIPIPAIVFNQIAMPLQLVAAQFGQSLLSALSIPVLREGNVIVLANTSLEVAEACSGIRSLVSLLTVAIVCGYFVDRRFAVRLALVAASVPVAIATNGLRVACTGVAAHHFGRAAAEGFFHAFSGWLMFVPALALLLGLAKLLQALWPQPNGGAPHAVPVV